MNTRVGTGEATGLEVGEIHGPVRVVNNHVFLGDAPPELLARLGAFKRVGTEVRPDGESPSASLPDAIELPAIEEDVNVILAHVRSAEARGTHVEGVQVGDLRLSRVELLVKQAILLKTEADQMFLDRVDRNRARVDAAKTASPGPTFEIDLNDILEGFDGDAHEAKLREAFDLLQEANRLDPSNAEVLLHMAQVMDQLEDEPHETRRILLRVQALLDSPRDDVDRFHLAQARFLSAVTGEHTNPDQLRSAREMFSQLGRVDWVRQCDDLLAAASGHSGGRAGMVEAPPNPNSPKAAFQPIGHWTAQMSNGGMLTLALHPGGAMQGQQSHGMFGSVPFAGQWQFDPSSGTLWLQGLVAGSSHFVLQIIVHGHQGGGFQCIGSDGVHYYLTRAG